VAEGRERRCFEVHRLNARTVTRGIRSPGKEAGYEADVRLRASVFSIARFRLSPSFFNPHGSVARSRLTLNITRG